MQAGTYWSRPASTNKGHAKAIPNSRGTYFCPMLNKIYILVVSGSCRNVRGTIIESEEKVDDIDSSVFSKRAAVFWIYISSNIGVRTLYLSDPLSIQLDQFHLWLSSVCSVLSHLMKIPIQVQVWAEANDLSTSKNTIDWWRAVLFIGVA